MDVEGFPAFGSFSGKGSCEYNCDFVAGHVVPSTGATAVALVDGMGDTFEVASDVFLCAHAAARVGAVKGALPGVLAATEMLGADPAVEFPSPDGVLVLAVCRPVGCTDIAYIGDAAAFSYDPAAEPVLTRLTEDHTVGQRLRLRGVHEEEAAPYDAGVVTSIGRATVGTVTVVSTGAPYTLLCSDGVHRALTEQAIAEILAQRLPGLDCATQALVDAAFAAGGGDDATAALLRRC